MSKAGLSAILGPTEMTLHVLAERRCKLYERVAEQVLVAEDALSGGDGATARRALEEIRRSIRTGLAYVTDEVYEELEHLEATYLTGPTVVEGGAAADLRDHLTLLHVKLARSLRAPFLQELEDIVALGPRLKRKLAASRDAFRERLARRELEEKAWELEAEARDALAAGKHRRAIKQLKRAIKLDPGKPVFHNDLGFVYSALGWYPYAITEYRTAIELNEKHPEHRTEEWTTTYFNLGIAQRKKALQGLGTLGDDVDPKSAAFQNVIEELVEARSAFEHYLQTTPTGNMVDRTRELMTSLDATIKELPAREGATRESSAA